MDEVFSVFDFLICKDMQDEFFDFYENVGKMIIFIMYDFDEVLCIGDRIVLMKDGNIVQIGILEEILMSLFNEYVEKFVEDVDLFKVFIVGYIMKCVEIVWIDKGFCVVLILMKNLGILFIYVVDK